MQALHVQPFSYYMAAEWLKLSVLEWLLVLLQQYQGSALLQNSNSLRGLRKPLTANQAVQSVACSVFFSNQPCANPGVAL